MTKAQLADKFLNTLALRSVMAGKDYAKHRRDNTAHLYRNYCRAAAQDIRHSFSFITSLDDHRQLTRWLQKECRYWINYFRKEGKTYGY